MNSGGSDSMPIGNEFEDGVHDKQLKLQIDEIVYRILKLQLQKYELQRQSDQRRDQLYQTLERFVGQLGNIMWENSDDNTTDDTTDTGGERCAVCAYQNKECTPDCIFAPCFPQELHHVFLIAHRLFGMDRIVEILTGPNGSGPVAALHRLTLDENLRLSLELHRELRLRNREINEKMLQQIDKVKSEIKDELDPNIIDLNVIHQMKMESTISTRLFLVLLLKFVAYHA